MSIARHTRPVVSAEMMVLPLPQDGSQTAAPLNEATGWAAHTVRSFFAGLRKKGFEVQVLERVRMVGPNNEGAKGSHADYHIAD